MPVIRKEKRNRSGIQVGCKPVSSEFAIRSSTAQPSSRHVLPHSLATDDFKLDAQLLLIKKEFLQETETEPQFFEQPVFCCSLQLFFPSFSSEYSRLPEALKYWKEEKTFLFLLQFGSIPLSHFRADIKTTSSPGSVASNSSR